MHGTQKGTGPGERITELLLGFTLVAWVTAYVWVWREVVERVP